MFGWYLWGWENIWTLKSSLGWFHLAIKILAWYANPNGIENKNFLKHPYAISGEWCEFLIVDIQMVSLNNNTKQELV